MSANIILAILSLAGVAAASGAKENPKGIYVLIPGLLSSINHFGTDPWDNHPAIQYPYVDGFRFREEWADVQPDNASSYDWTEIESAIACARRYGKKFSVSISAGIHTPPWVMGGQKFTDGAYTVGASTITSPQCTFSSADSGRYLSSNDWPPGTTFGNNITNSGHTINTVAPVTAPSLVGPMTSRTSTGSPLKGIPGGIFWILERNAGQAIPVLTGTGVGNSDLGLMPRAWSAHALVKFQAFVTEFGRLYDNTPEISYVVFNGPQQLAQELYAAQGNTEAAARDALASTDPEAKKLDGTQAGNAHDAWERTAQATMSTYLSAFPETAILVEFAVPYANDKTAEPAFEAWCHTAPRIGRIGYMTASLWLGTQPALPRNSYVMQNHVDSPAGFQMLARINSCLFTSPNNVSPPALYNTLIYAATMGGTNPDSGGRFVEVYESDFDANPSVISANEFITARNRLVGVSGPAYQPSPNGAPPPPTGVKIVF